MWTRKAIVHSFQDVRTPWKEVQLEAKNSRQKIRNGYKWNLVVEWRPMKNELSKLVDGSEKNASLWGLAGRYLRCFCSDKFCIFLNHQYAWEWIFAICFPASAGLQQKNNCHLGLLLTGEFGWVQWIDRQPKHNHVAHLSCQDFRKVSKQDFAIQQFALPKRCN